MSISNAKRIFLRYCLVAELFERQKKRVAQTDNPEVRSLRELKKGLTDGLKGGFWGIVSLRIGFMGNTHQGNLISCDYYLKFRVFAPSRFFIS